jgi:hypothetical protein
MYLWTTFGLVSALERIWKSQQESIVNKVTISPYIIEVTAMLERALAMAYTGDARVITIGLMGPFGLKRSLVENGLPSIAMNLSFDHGISNQFAIRPANWPVTKYEEPAIASKRTQVLTYGEGHFAVRLFLSIKHLGLLNSIM